MSDLIYAGAVVFGAVTLLIEANRTYSAPAGENSFRLSPILQSVEASDLCTPGESRVGFAFYGAFYLITYAIIVGSTELLQLLISASAVRSQVGAIDGDILLTDTGALTAATDYGKPIFVSALIISLLSTGYLQKIEKLIRGLAHQLAGVPRGIFRVMDVLRGIQFDALDVGNTGVLSDRFEISLEVIPDAIGEKHAPKIAEIKKKLAAIDCLYAATTDSRGDIYFPIRQLEKLKNSSNELKKGFEALQNMMEPVSKEYGNLATGADLPRYLTEVAAATDLVRSNTIAVFALLYLKNNRTIMSQNRSRLKVKAAEQPDATINPIEQLRQDLKDVHDIEQNALAMSVLVAALLGGLAIFGIYQWWHSYVAATAPAIAAYLQVSPDNYDLAACEALRECRLAAQLHYQNSQIPLNLTSTTWDVALSVSMILLCVFFTIEGREYRMDEQSWNSGWRMRQLPFTKLLSLSIVPALLAVLAAALVFFLKMAWGVNFHLTESQILDLVSDSGWFIALQAGSGLILSFAALTIMDRHESFSAGQTFFSALVFAGIFLIYTRFSIYLTYGAETSNGLGTWLSRSGRDAVILSLTPAIFLLMFAILLEFSEGKPAGPT